MKDWIGHHLDIAHWGIGFDVTALTKWGDKGSIPRRGELWNAAKRYRFTAKYKGAWRLPYPAAKRTFAAAPGGSREGLDLGGTARGIEAEPPAC